MRCPNCGVHLQPDRQVCPACGQAIVVSATSRSKWPWYLAGVLAVIVLGGIVFNFVARTKGGFTGLYTNSPQAFKTSVSNQNFPTEIPSLTPIPYTNPTHTLVPTFIPTSQPVSLTPTSSPIPFEIQKNIVDGADMVLVPAGEFLMGSEPKNDPYFWGAESPEHRVFLDAFYIYRTEVTNGMYSKCVEAKKCPKPEKLLSNTRDQYFNNPDYKDFPVIYVSWISATSYCQWAGSTLPTEAQWEKAARGTDGRMFPWGNELPDSSRVQFMARDTAQVGSFYSGMSPYGAFDMAGNVLEWVSDYFQSGYYQNSPDKNPLGPGSGNRHVIRGGAWHHSEISGLRTAARASLKSDSVGDNLGFRCVVPVK